MNHFIEIDKDSQDNLYLVIHTGSRHLGMEVCKYYQNLAYDRMAIPAKNLEYQKQQKALIQSLKDSGREREIEQALKDFKQTYRLKNPPIPKDLAFLEGADCDHYLHDVQIVQEQANCNREAIARTICEHMDFHVIDSFHTIHNYIDVPNRILRKGSVSAQRGQQLLIPINMRDGALLCVGKGNPDYNFSAPHGAGRLMSRSKAKETISLDEFKESMKGISSTSVNTSTIDESPMAYRNMDEIVENIHPTAEIIEHLIPIYNFKASVPDDVEDVEND